MVGVVVIKLTCLVTFHQLTKTLTAKTTCTEGIWHPVIDSVLVYDRFLRCSCNRCFWVERRETWDTQSAGNSVVCFASHHSLTLCQWVYSSSLKFFLLVCFFVLLTALHSLGLCQSLNVFHFVHLSHHVIFKVHVCCALPPNRSILILLFSKSTCKQDFR